MQERVRVLLVEDDEDDFILTRDLLLEGRRERYELDWVRTSDEGWAAIRNRAHDVYLLDYRLGAGTGLDLLRMARKARIDDPIILLTGLHDREVDIEAMKAGASDYLVKGRLDAPLLERSIRYSLEQFRTLRALRESEERYALSALGANDGLWVWDLQAESVYYSPRWKEMLGYGEDEVGSAVEEWLGRVHEADRGAINDAIARHLEGRTSHLEQEYRMQTRSGHFRWMLVRGLAVRDDLGRAYRFAGSQTDVTDRKLALEQLSHDALHDSLTGLPNRTLFLDRLDLALRRIVRTPDHRFAVLFLDLDRFKVVNDSLGHAVGDDLLQRVAERLGDHVRESDTIARFGGDEFTILLDGVDSITDVVRACDRIRESLADPFHIEGHDLPISASIGIALSETGYQSPNQILRDADIAMYRAKSAGRGQYALFDAAMHDRAYRLLELESKLHHAIHRRELDLAFQPIIRFGDRTLYALEALLRWNHDGRIIPPAEIIPVAEESGLIVPVGEWVLNEACKRLAEWRLPERSPRVAVNVNLSPRQFFEQALCGRIESLIDKFALRPGELILEVTESVLIEDAESALGLLDRLRKIGVVLALDDFGTGYSSLGSLVRYPFHMVKIDKIFVDRAEKDARGLELIRGITALARSLDLEVVIEGIETEAQFECVRDVGADYVQGFYFQRPVASEKVAALVADTHQPDTSIGH